MKDELKIENVDEKVWNEVQLKSIPEIIKKLFGEEALHRELTLEEIEKVEDVRDNQIPDIILSDAVKQ